MNFWGLATYKFLLKLFTFGIETDSKSVTYIHPLKKLRGLYARWAEFIANFHFTVTHIVVTV